MIVEVLVSQGEAGDALRQLEVQRVFRQAGIASVRETGGHPFEQPDAAVGLRQQ